MAIDNIDRLKKDVFDADALLSLLSDTLPEETVKNTIKKEEVKEDSEDESAWLDKIANEFGIVAEDEREKKHVIAYNIDDYSPDIYSDEQLDEIKKGIDHRLQVDLYSDENLTARQMRELRYGLERNLDIKYYNNKYIRERQMKEIRIGLQQGLDVEKYAKIIFSATDMKNKRIQQFLDKYQDSINTVSYDYDDLETNLHIYVEPGLMEAGIVIKDSLPEKFTKFDLKKLMEAYDITEGFQEKLIPQNLANLPKGVKIPIMFGKEAKAGKDGWFEYNFPADEDSRPKINDDGSVDYKAPKTFKAVKRGETVVTYHAALVGEEGLTVTGIPVRGYVGKEQEPLKSDDLVMSRDKTYYMSKKEGFASIVNGQIKIMDNLVFNEDLTVYNNAKINFDGTVQIKGTVGDDVEIVATGNIYITGFVESARLVAGGDIVITGGVNGDNGGIIIAKGNITSGFFENANAEAGANIETGYILNSNITADGQIKVKGKKALICGGQVVGREGVVAGVVGTSAGAKTVIEVGGNNDEFNDNYYKAINDKKSAEAEIEKIHFLMDSMVKKMGILSIRQDESYIKLQSVLEMKKQARDDSQKIIDELEAKRIARMSITVEITKTLYENVMLNLSGNRLVTKEVYNRPIIRNDGRNVVIEK